MYTLLFLTNYSDHHYYVSIICHEEVIEVILVAFRRLIKDARGFVLSPETKSLYNSPIAIVKLNNTMVKLLITITL